MTDYKLINDVCKMREENRMLKTQLSRIWLMLDSSDYVKSRPKEEIVRDVKEMVDALPRKES